MNKNYRKKRKIFFFFLKKKKRRRFTLEKSKWKNQKFKVKKCRPRKEGGNTTGNDGIIIYPNPNKGVFKLVIGESRKPNKVEIFNTIGQLVFVNELIKEDEISIDISNEASGIYLVKLTGEKYQKMKKIIIN